MGPSQEGWKLGACLHQGPPASPVLVQDLERHFTSFTGLVYPQADYLHTLFAIQSLPLWLSFKRIQSSLETALFYQKRLT